MAAQAVEHPHRDDRRQHQGIERAAMDPAIARPAHDSIQRLRGVTAEMMVRDVMRAPQRRDRRHGQ